MPPPIKGRARDAARGAPADERMVWRSSAESVAAANRAASLPDDYAIQLYSELYKAV